MTVEYVYVYVAEKKNKVFMGMDHPTSMVHHRLCDRMHAAANVGRDSRL